MGDATATVSWKENAAIAARKRPMTVFTLACALCSLALLLLAPEGEGVWMRGLAIVPLLIALLVFIENPAPGEGVGKAAAPLPGLNFIGTKKDIAPTPLGDGGALLIGHAYIIVFFNTRRACLRAAVKADKVARMLKAAGCADWFHTLLVSRDDAEALEHASNHWRDRATPLAHDASEAASANYISAHRAWAQPHAFIVDRRGMIMWHGQINRKGLQDTIALMLRGHLREKAVASGRVGASGTALKGLPKQDPPAKGASAAQAETKGSKAE
jgi:hypothetical protein